jgi:peptidyl-prolyl cis-trans isomerase SurA
MTMRPAVLSAILALVATLATAAPTSKPVEVAGAGGAREVNGIAAKVNGTAVTKNEVAFQLAPLAAQLAAQYPRRGPEFERLLTEARNKILDELIDRQLILYEAKSRGANLPARVVEEEVKRQVRELYNGSEERFREELKRAGLTMEGYRKLTQDKLIVQAMRTHQFADAPPPLPAEVESEYAAVKTTLRDMNQDKITFRKIFIPRQKDNDPTATPESQLALAEDLVKQLAAGADFAELAKQHSADAYAEQGGEWPETNRTDLAPEFAAIVFEAAENKVVGPLEDPNGFTIVIVKDKKLGPPPPLSKVRPMIEERVYRKKTAQKYERYINRLRKTGMIERKI